MCEARTSKQVDEDLKNVNSFLKLLRSEASSGNPETKAALDVQQEKNSALLAEKAAMKPVKEQLVTLKREIDALSKRIQAKREHPDANRVVMRARCQSTIAQCTN